MQTLIEYLGNNASCLWEQTGAKDPDPADPWLIAVAHTHGYTLVTNESRRSGNTLRAACRLPQIRCRCIHGLFFLYEAGLIPRASAVSRSVLDIVEATHRNNDNRLVARER